MGRPRSKEDRAHKGVNVNRIAYEICIKKGLNVSDICSIALEKAAFDGSSPSNNPITQERELLLAGLKALDKKEEEVGVSFAQEELKKQDRLAEFLEGTADDVINNDTALSYWAQKTGLVAAELKAAKLKKLASEVGRKKIDQEQARLRQIYLEDQKKKEGQA